MKKGNDIDTELRELKSRLANLPRTTPYAAPEAAYFESLAPVLLAGNSATESADPVVGFSRSMPFEIPAGYFETLAETLAAGAQFSQKIDTPFVAPDGYFQELPELLMSAIRAAETEPAPLRQKSRVMPLFRRSAFWMVAAAALAGLWFGLGRNAAPVSALQDPAAALASLPQDSIGAYVERHVEEFDTESFEMALAGTQAHDYSSAVSGLRSDEIEDYLNDAGFEHSAPEDGI